MFKKCYVAEVTIEGRVIGSVCISIPFFRNHEHSYGKMVDGLEGHSGGLINFRRVK